jgi:hypothetical protein
MPQPTKPADKKADVKPVEAPKDRQLKNLQHKERQAIAKLDRITKWPKEHQKAATTATEKKLSHIREEMQKLAH